MYAKCFVIDRFHIILRILEVIYAKDCDNVKHPNVFLLLKHCHFL